MMQVLAMAFQTNFITKIWDSLKWLLDPSGLSHMP